MRRLALSGLLLATSLHAQWNAPVLGGFGVATLSDEAISRKLSARFKASGSPVFLIGNPSLGLQQGDIIRFKDKAVLIDTDVWQTLRMDGALPALKVAPVVRVKAAANPVAWAGRARALPAGKERRAYELGEQLLRVFQKSFGATPDGQKIYLAFESGQLVLSAPPGFIEQLKGGRIESSSAGSSAAQASLAAPKLVGSPPPLAFLGKDFRWQAWAVDPSGGPTREVKFSLSGALPTGLAWNADEHSLAGKPAVTGTWPLILRAANGAGSDSLAFTLATAPHRTPRIANEPATPEPGQPWSFRPEPDAPDHPARELSLLVRRLPAGMAWDSLRRELTWRAPDSLSGRTVPLELCVRDPLGDSALGQWSLTVQRRTLDVSTDGLRLDLPWDTLVAGHTYRWDLSGLEARWRQDGVALVGVASDDSLIRDGAALELRPVRPGPYALLLRTRRNGADDSVAVRLAVRPDRAPLFLSRVACDSLRYDQAVRYRPVAIDPEGDSVRLSAILPPRSPLTWDGTTLSLRARQPGCHRAEILATDAHGMTSRQQVTWTVDPSGKDVFLEARRESDLGLWTVGTDLGAVRLGLFAPSVGRIGWDTRLDMQLPYVFLGVNLWRHGTERATLDAGFTGRSPAPQVWTGGGMARLQGNLRWSWPIAWHSDLDVTGWIDQAILVADSTQHQTITLTWDNMGSSSWNLNQVDAWRKPAWKAFRKAQADQARRDNSVVLARLDALAELRPWLQVGPSWWMDARPLRNEVENFAGCSLKSDLRAGPVRFTPQGRMGWGFGGSGLTMAGSVSLNLGGE